MKLKSSIKFFLIIALISFLGIVSGAHKQNNKQKNMQKMMKDLYSANFEDLQKMGVVLPPKANSILGRANLKSMSSISAEALREDVKDAQPGKCDPKPVCISNPLTLNITSTQYAFPPCINIHRCDGCCANNEKCVAINSHEVKLQKVGVINFEEDNSPKFAETFISVLNHTDCQCQCQWQTDEDCKAVNPNYVKNEYACECICPTEMYCGPLREFDPESCSCKCKKANFGRLEQSCKFRGFTWSDSQCRCDTTKTSFSVNQKEIRIKTK